MKGPFISISGWVSIRKGKTQKEDLGKQEYRITIKVPPCPAINHAQPQSDVTPRTVAEKGARKREKT